MKKMWRFFEKFIEEEPTFCLEELYENKKKKKKKKKGIEAFLNFEKKNKEKKKIKNKIKIVSKKKRPCHIKIEEICIK